MAAVFRIAIVFGVVALIGLIAALPEISRDESEDEPAPAAKPADVEDTSVAAVDDSVDDKESAVEPTSVIDRTAPNISSAVRIDKRINEYRGLTNNDTSGAFMLTEENYILGGEYTLRGRGGASSRSKTAIQGVDTPEGTRIVQVDVGRGSPANIFGMRIAAQVANDARILLVDTEGQTYTAIGFFYARPNKGKQLKIDPGTRFDNTTLLPRPPTTHQGDLRLIYQVTEGATLDALTYGDTTVGTFNGITVTK